MAKFHLDRLRDKYGWKTAVEKGKITGERYQKLINEVLAVNSENITRATMRISRENIDKYSKTLRTKEKRFVLPDVSEALPKRSVFLLKSAERGQLLTDTIRDKLTKDLREVMKQPGVVRRAGTMAGTINPSAIREFEKKITESFRGYTKKDPRYGVPGNIHNIAVTEMRINVDQAKFEYMKRVEQKNAGKAEITKTWQQNRSLSKEPRSTHKKLNGQTIKFDEYFEWQTEKGKTVRALHPHAASLPPEEVIGCNCDAVYKIKLLK